MDERLRFIARLLEGEAMNDVCREFGVSRLDKRRLPGTGAMPNTATPRTPTAGGGIAGCAPCSARRCYTRYLAENHQDENISGVGQLAYDFATEIDQLAEAFGVEHLRRAEKKVAA